MKRNLVVGIAAACAIGGMVGLGGAAIARGDGNDGKHAPPTSATDDLERAGMPADRWERQARLVTVVSGIESVVDPTESGRPTRPGMDGYLLVKIDLEMNSVELFWKGDIPAKLQRVIEAHPDVQVRIHTATYSEIQYMDAQDALSALVRSAVAEAEGDAQLIGIGHVGDWEGFQVVLYDPDRVVSVSDLLRRYANAGFLDVPIDVEYSKEKPRPPGLSRLTRNHD